MNDILYGIKFFRDFSYGVSFFIKFIMEIFELFIYDGFVLLISDLLNVIVVKILRDIGVL